jgi:hypothetical protein
MEEKPTDAAILKELAIRIRQRLDEVDAADRRAERAEAQLEGFHDALAAIAQHGPQPRCQCGCNEVGNECDADCAAQMVGFAMTALSKTDWKGAAERRDEWERGIMEQLKKLFAEAGVKILVGPRAPLQNQMEGRLQSEDVKLYFRLEFSRRGF